MTHHITLRLANRDDFKQLVTFIEGAGYRLLSVDHQELEVECKVDSFIQSLAEKYLDAAVVYHNNSVIMMEDKMRSKVTFENVPG